MSAEVLINILQQESTRNRFKALIQLSKDRTYTIKQIYTEVKHMGLKPFEWYQILKYVNNPEILYNQLAMLEQISEHLLD